MQNVDYPTGMHPPVPDRPHQPACESYTPFYTPTARQMVETENGAVLGFLVNVGENDFLNGLQ